MLKIYENFEESLLKNWQNLYSSIGGNYNVSYEWCKTWFKHFGKNKKLHIVTIWDEDELKLLAPFYIKKDRLYLIGSNPDLYDEFDIICSDSEYYEPLVDYIFENKLNIDFKFVNPESDFAKLFVRKLVNLPEYSSKIYEYTLKPVVSFDENFNLNIAKKIKRKISKIRNICNQDPVFEFNPEKKLEYINEFIELHKNKWGFFNKKDFEPFIKDLYFNTDIAYLFRLFLAETDENLAYGFGFIDSKHKFSGMLTTHNSNLSAGSPGLILFYQLISELYNKGYAACDLGKGGMDYKYNFTKQDSILINVSAKITWKKWSFLYNPLKIAKKEILQKTGRL